MKINHYSKSDAFTFFYTIRFFVLFSIFLLQPIMSADLLFDSESVFVDVILPDTVSVYGCYNFVNPSKKKVTQAIVYPFPVDSLSNFPYRISIKKKGCNNEIPFKRINQGVLFTAIVDSNNSETYRINYSQKVNDCKGCYILITTRDWSKSLRYSELAVSISAGQVFKYISYVADTVILTDNKLRYRFSFKEFMPDKDLIFSW
jgi:hypothetical protein